MQAVTFLGIAFAVIVTMLAFHRPLYQAILGGLLALALLCHISLVELAGMVWKVVSSWSSLSILLALYTITFLQRILEARSQIKLAQQDLNGIFHNRRINTMGAALFIGLLPSAASMLLCSEMVKDAAEDYLTPQEQAFTASWFRHIPESTLPTYTAVLLMLNLSGVPASQFILGMFFPMLVLAVIGYVRYLRKIPKDPGTSESGSRRQNAIHLFQHLWSLILILVLILLFHLDIVWSVLVSILISLVVYRVKTDELKKFAHSAVETQMLLNTFLVLVLKEVITYTGVLEALPQIMSTLPLPPWLMFGLLFFFTALISGSTAAISVGTPLAFSAIPGGMPLMVLLMCFTHAASQLSPTHVCLVVASEYFRVPLGVMIRKTLPAALIFCGVMILYYQVLVLL